jgi:hypothetical protein
MIVHWELSINHRVSLFPNEKHVFDADSIFKLITYRVFSTPKNTELIYQLRMKFYGIMRIAFSNLFDLSRKFGGSMPLTFYCPVVSASNTYHCL